MKYPPGLLLNHDKLHNNVREHRRGPFVLEGSDSSSFLNLESIPTCVSLQWLISLSAFVKKESNYLSSSIEKGRCAIRTKSRTSATLTPSKLTVSSDSSILDKIASDILKIDWPR